MQTQAQAPMQEVEKLSFSCTCIWPAIVFHTCEQERRKRKCRRKIHTSASSAILEKRLRLRLRILTSLRLRLTCECRLHLRRKCEPGLSCHISKLDYQNAIS